MQGDERERAFIKAKFIRDDRRRIERASEVRLGSNLRRPVFLLLRVQISEFLIIDEKYDKIKWRIG